MLLASFIPGLMGSVGRETRYAMPSNWDDAINLATTVDQAKIDERRNESFYVDEAGRYSTPDRTSRGTLSASTVRSTPQHAGAGRTQNQYRQGQSQSTGNGVDRKCYECGGVGHFALYVLTAGIAGTSEALLVLEVAMRRRDLQGHPLQKRRGNTRDGKTT